MFGGVSLSLVLCVCVCVCVCVYMRMQEKNILKLDFLFFTLSYVFEVSSHLFFN